MFGDPTCSPVRSFWPSSVFLHLLIQLRAHEGTVQNKTLSKEKNTPHPTKLGPINFSSRVLNPFSPSPTKVMISPTDIIPSPT